MSYWVINNQDYVATITVGDEKIVLSNGLIAREIVLENCVTDAFDNSITGERFVDSGMTDFAFVCDNKRVDSGVTFVEARRANMLKVVDFFPNKSMSEQREYPPKGQAVELVYSYKNLLITVHYEIYDGIPTIGKQVTVKNIGKDSVAIDNIFVDIMNIEKIDNLFVDSNFNAHMQFLGLNFAEYANLYARHTYKTLEVAPLHRMNVTLRQGEIVESIIAYESAFVAEYYESRLIEVKSIYKTLAPWTLDCSVFFHLIANSARAIKKTVDCCKEVGVELIIQSFGSGVNMESQNKIYLNKIKRAYAYGHANGIKMGAYTLAYVKNYSPVRSHEALNHDYSHICRCLANDWAEKYTAKVLHFLDVTKADAIEIDGPYAMMLCAGGKTHHHDDFTDSQYKQWKHSVLDWYKEIRKRNVYINAPDWHYLCGTNRDGVGYEEIAFSEKRQEQLITSRIYYYKGTFAKTPSQSWGFVPLNVYHGGGADAQFCPTDKNAFDYDWAIAQCVASGVMPTLRGKKVYDSEQGKNILAKWIGIYKKYRTVINGITVHFLPPQIDKNNYTRTTALDAILNLYPQGEVRGFLTIFNQTDRDITQTLNVPLYYSGLTALDSPPPPVENTKNSDVPYPLYGVEATPLVIVASEKTRIPLVTDKKVVDKEIPPLSKATLTDKKVIFSKNETSDVVANIDSNGNAQLNVALPAMSYCYYIIKKPNE
ncbi:MAG: hypothetical protein RSB61_03205 [Clostridia bacterium]